MKQAKRADAMHRKCGNCAKTIRIKYDDKNVACVPHLKLMPADHPGECEHYTPDGMLEAAPPP